MLIGKDITNIIVGLWDFDKYKVYSDGYYSYELENIKIKCETDEPIRDNFAMIMFIYCLNSVDKNLDCNLLLHLHNVRKVLNIQHKYLGKASCINGANILAKIKIEYNGITYPLIEISNDTTIIVGEWIKKIPIANFIDMNIDYSFMLKPLIYERIGVMTLPFVIINYYYYGKRKHKNFQLFKDVLSCNKAIRRRVLENYIDHVREIIEGAGLYLHVDCDFTPTEFTCGNCQISKHKDIIMVDEEDDDFPREALIPVNKLVKFDKNKKISREVFFNKNEYFISESGKLYNRSKKLKDSENTHGYITNTLRDKDNKLVPFLRHQIVAQVFLWDSYIEGSTVDHLDGNRHNNSLSNLRWATTSEQIDNRKIEE